MTRVEQTFSLWLHGAQDPRLTGFVREETGSYGFDMWSKAAREISRSYSQWGSPLQALAGLHLALPITAPLRAT
jgi:hypothetical protein